MRQTNADNFDDLNGQSPASEQFARVQTEAANRIKDEFLATLSHEIRTPLNSILGWVTLLRNHALSEAEAQRALEVIERNARSQSHLINDLLDASSILNGKLRLDVRTLMPETIVSKAVESVRPAAMAKHIRLQTHLETEAGPVLADAERLQQIVWNLLLNAIKFTPKDGQVDVTLRQADAQVEILICDTGIGIEPELLPYIFDRFRQGDSSTTRKYGGLGLGLAMVRYLVEMHGGLVTAESKGLNQGAAFSVRLPAEQDVLQAVAEQSLIATMESEEMDCVRDLAGLRILVVEDDYDCRQFLVALLERCQAEVRRAGNAVDALKTLETWQPEIIISDIEMPLMNGYEFIRNVRNSQTLAKVPAVALTAYARVEDRLRALSSGFQMHLAKPAEPAELLTVVASLTKRIASNRWCEAAS